MGRPSPLAKAVRDRIEEEYEKNPRYAFTADDFSDLTESRYERQQISRLFKKLSAPSYRKCPPVLKKLVKRAWGSRE